MSKPFIGRLDPPYYACHLGDGVYASFDGLQVWLDRRARGTAFHKNPEYFPAIALESDVIQMLVAYEQEAIRQYKPDTA